jgi:hypothetical protein
MRLRAKLNFAGRGAKFVRGGFVYLGVGFLAFGVVCRGEEEPDKKKMEIPLPIGHDIKGLRVPWRSNDGKLELRLEIETARRISEQVIEMHTTNVQTYDQETGKPDAKIVLLTSQMNTETNLITSNDPVKITRDDFELTGDRLEFNTKTRQGKIIGHVRLLIFNRDELTAHEPKKKDASSDEPK